VIKPVKKIIKKNGFRKEKVITPKLTFKTETIKEMQTKMVPKKKKVKKYTLTKKLMKQK